MQKIIYIPSFPGFYHSHLSAMVDQEEEYIIENYIEEGILKEWDDYEELCEVIDIDYTTTHENIAKDYYCEYEGIVNELWLEKIGIKLWAFESLWNPEYYNYSSDEVKVYCEIDINKILEYLESKKEAFTKFIQENNRSCDGFISFMDDSYSVYIDNIKDDLKENQVSQIIEFFIEENVEDHYEEIEDPIYSVLSWDIWLVYKEIVKNNI